MPRLNSSWCELKLLKNVVCTVVTNITTLRLKAYGSYGRFRYAQYTLLFYLREKTATSKYNFELLTLCHRGVKTSKPLWKFRRLNRIHGHQHQLHHSPGWRSIWQNTAVTVSTGFFEASFLSTDSLATHWRALLNLIRTIETSEGAFC